MRHIVIITNGKFGLHSEKEVLIMKQVVHVIRKADVEKEYVKLLNLELDYELAT